MISHVHSTKLTTPIFSPLSMIVEQKLIQFERTSVPFKRCESCSLHSAQSSSDLSDRRTEHFFTLCHSVKVFNNRCKVSCSLNRINFSPRLIYPVSHSDFTQFESFTHLNLWKGGWRINACIIQHFILLGSIS